MKNTLLMLLISLFSFSASAQHYGSELGPIPSGPATIEGRIVHPNPETNLGGIDVVLYAITASGAPGIARTQTDAKGEFRFSKISNSPTNVYLIGGRYMEIPFPGERAQFAQGQKTFESTIEISDVRPTVGPSDHPIRVLESQMKLEQIGNRLLITETHSIQNDNTFTVFVKERGSREAIFRADLPKGLSDFAMPYGIIPEGIDQHQSYFGFRGPLYPGDQEISFSYELPLAEAELEIERGFTTQSERLLVLVPPGKMELHSPSLEAKGPLFLERKDIAAGERIVLQLKVPEARPNPAALTVDEIRVVMRLDGLVLHVNEEHFFYVEGGQSVVGTADQPLVRITLPPRASDVRFDEKSLRFGLTASDSGDLIAQGPIPPGPSSIDITYALPISASAIELTRSFHRPVPIYTLYVQDSGLLMESSRLHRKRPVASEQSIYQSFEAFQLDPLEEVTIQLVPLQPRRNVPRVAANAAALVSFAVVLFFLFTPLLSAVQGSEQQATLSIERQERESVYAAIHDLEEDYRTGNVEEESYPALREELLGRAGALLASEREQKTSPPVVSSTSPPVSPLANPSLANPPLANPPLANPTGSGCPSCGDAIRSQDRFCPQCGTALTGADEEPT